MVLLGVDPHQDTHTVVAVDQAGRQLDQRTVPARTLAHGELVGWARMPWPDRRWAVEDCRHVTGRRERDLLAAGERVVRVPPRLMAGARQAGRVQGRSDPIDALAVARAALREPTLPVAQHDQASWEVKLLVDHREPLVAERTRRINRLRWHLHQLDPDREHATRRPPGPGLRRITAWLAHATADPGSWCRSGSARPKSPPSRPSPTRSASWTVNSANASPSRPIPAQPARLRAADRGQAHRRDRRRGPVPLPGRPRHARRRRPDPGQLRPHRPPPAATGRPPPAEGRPAPHRHHPAPPVRPRPELRPATPRPGRWDRRGRPGPQAPHRPRRLPATPSGSAASRHRPHGSRLTEEQPSPGGLLARARRLQLFSPTPRARPLGRRGRHLSPGRQRLGRRGRR
jgi:transposase